VNDRVSAGGDFLQVTAVGNRGVREPMERRTPRGPATLDTTGAERVEPRRTFIHGRVSSLG
jgi:hypothetical protein